MSSIEAKNPMGRGARNTARGGAAILFHYFAGNAYVDPPLFAMAMHVTLIPGARNAQAAILMQAGSVCACLAPHDADPGRFLWTSLLAASSGPGPAAWLLTTRRTPPALEPPAALAPACTAALESARIKVLRHDLIKPAVHQVRRILAELDCFLHAPGTLLVVDCADHWLGRAAKPGESPLIAQFQRWAEGRQVAVLMLFHASGPAHVERAVALLGQARHLGGVARLVRGRAEVEIPGAALRPELSCRMLFWFGQAAVVADTELALSVCSDGTLAVDAAVRSFHDSDLALDVNAVVVQRSALAGSGGAPAHWTVCDSLDEVLAACSTAQAATVILTFERTTPQDILMRAVYQLRQLAGNRLKIIVRELHVRLRYNEEALLARLGASLVVPMEVGYARFLSMMEMLQSQQYCARLPATFEQATTEGLPQQVAGYLAPQDFTTNVMATLARSRALAIDNVLVRLTLASGLTPIDAMRHCTVKRAGDLFTCDRKGVLVFLFACRELDATQTLERIFALPVGELFSSEYRYISNDAASAAIDEFAQRAIGGRLPDYSQELERINALRRGSGERGERGQLDADVSTPMRVVASMPHPTALFPAPAVQRQPRHTPLQLHPQKAVPAHRDRGP